MPKIRRHGRCCAGERVKFVCSSLTLWGSIKKLALLQPWATSDAVNSALKSTFTWNMLDCDWVSECMSLPTLRPLQYSSSPSVKACSLQALHNVLCEASFLLLPCLVRAGGARQLARKAACSRWVYEHRATSRDSLARGDGCSWQWKSSDPRTVEIHWRCSSFKFPGNAQEWTWQLGRCCCKIHASSALCPTSRYVHQGLGSQWNGLAECIDIPSSPRSCAIFRAVLVRRQAEGTGPWPTWTHSSCSHSWTFDPWWGSFSIVSGLPSTQYLWSCCCRWEDAPRNHWHVHDNLLGRKVRRKCSFCCIRESRHCRNLPRMVWDPEIHYAGALQFGCFKGFWPELCPKQLELPRCYDHCRGHWGTVWSVAGCRMSRSQEVVNQLGTWWNRQSPLERLLRFSLERQLAIFGEYCILEGAWCFGWVWSQESSCADPELCELTVELRCIKQRLFGLLHQWVWITHGTPWARNSSPRSLRRKGLVHCFQAGFWHGECSSDSFWGVEKPTPRCCQGAQWQGAPAWPFVRTVVASRIPTGVPIPTCGGKDQSNDCWWMDADSTAERLSFQIWHAKSSGIIHHVWLKAGSSMDERRRAGDNRDNTNITQREIIQLCSTTSSNWIPCGGCVALRLVWWWCMGKAVYCKEDGQVTSSPCAWAPLLRAQARVQVWKLADQCGKWSPKHCINLHQRFLVR